MQSDEKEIKICRLSLKNLKCSLVWPKESQKLNPGKEYYIKVALFFFITSFWVVSLLMHFIKALKDNVDVSLSEDVGFIVAFTGIYYMTFIYVKNQAKVAILLKDLSNFEEFGKPPSFDETDKNLTFWNKILIVYCIAGIFTYNVFKLLQIPQCKENNRLKGLNENCGLLTPTWFPFKVDYFPIFQIILLYIITTSQLLMKLGLNISYIALEIAHHIVLKIEHLKIMINQSLEINTFEQSRKKIVKCILYHMQILDFCKRLDSCFTNCMLVHLTITGAICGCLEKQVSDGENTIGAVIHVLGWFGALFTACVAGQTIESGSESVADAIWSSKWYEADMRLRKYLLIMLARSQKEVHLTAGPFGIMSYALVVPVLKMSYSIFALLNEVK